MQECNKVGKLGRVTVEMMSVSFIVEQAVGAIDIGSHQIIALQSTDLCTLMCAKSDIRTYPVHGRGQVGPIDQKLSPCDLEASSGLTS